MIQNLIIPFTGSEASATGTWPTPFAAATYRLASGVVNTGVATDLVTVKVDSQSTTTVTAEPSDYLTGEVDLLGYDTVSVNNPGIVQTAIASFNGTETSIAITWAVAFTGNYQIATGRATGSSATEFSDTVPYRLKSKTSTGVTVECADIADPSSSVNFEIHLVAYGVS